MAINNISSSLITPQTNVLQTNKTSVSTATDQIFGSFNDMLNELSTTEQTSDNLLQQLSAGEDVDIHQVMLAATETDVSFKVALAIRDKLVESYREVMRMSV